MTKQDKIIAGLVVVGAIVAIVYLMKDSAPQVSGADASTGGLTPPAAALPSYPNSQPINTGAINIVTGSAPDALYNVPVNGYPLSDFGVGDLGGDNSCCDCDPCEQVTKLQSMMTIPPHVLERSVSNLKSYQAKRVMFTQP